MTKILNKLSHSYFGLKNHGFEIERPSHPSEKITKSVQTEQSLSDAHQGLKKSEGVFETPRVSSNTTNLQATSLKPVSLPESEKLLLLNKIKSLTEQNHKFSIDLKQSQFSLGQLQQQLVQQHKVLMAQEKDINILNTEKQSFEHFQLEQEIEQNKHFKIVELLKLQVSQQKKIIQNLTEQNQKLNQKVHGLEEQDSKLQRQILEQTETLQNKDQQLTELTQDLEQKTHLLRIAQKRQTQILSQVENLLVQEKTFLTGT